MTPFKIERTTQPKREGGATLRKRRMDTMSSCGIYQDSNSAVLLKTTCNGACQNETNAPHDFMNVELLLPVFFYARDMTHPYNSHHHGRHFYRRRKRSVT